MGSVDHLLYTSLRGGFQVVKATGLLADDRSPAAEEAERLCRYTRPGGVNDPAACPVSYGWTTVGRTRLVFRRGYLGKDLAGRPGNFCAHIVAGPVEDLPIALIAPHVSAGWWWQGEDVREYGEPPQWPFTELPALPCVPADLLHPFVDAVFQARSRAPVVLAGRRPDQTIAMMAEMAARVGEPFERVSVSTYEAAATSADFDVVGIAGPQDAPAGAIDPDEGGAGRTARRCRELVLSGDVQAEQVLKLATVVAMAERERRRFALLTRCLTAFDRVTAGEPIRAELVPPLLQRGYAAEMLLRYPAGVESVARALADDHEPSWQALGKSVDELPREPCDRLADHLGTELAQRLTDENIDRLESAPQRFAAGTVAALLHHGQPGIVAGLEWERRRTLLRLAPADLAQGSLLTTLLCSPPEARLAVADARELPAPWRGIALAEHARSLGSRKSKAMRPVVERMLADPALAAATASALPSAGVLTAMVDGLSVDEADRLVMGAAGGLAGERAPALLDALLGKYEPRWRLRVLAQVADRIHGSLSTTLWDRFVTGVLVEGFAVAADRLAYGRDAVPLLDRVGGRRSVIWLLVLDGVDATLAGGRDFRDQELRKALRTITHLEDAEGYFQARDLVLAQYLAWQPSVTRTARIAKVAGEECGYGSDEAAQLLLSLSVPVNSRICVVLHVAALVAQNALPLAKRKRRLHSKELQNAVEVTLRDMDPRDVQAVIARAERNYGGAVPWLYDASP